MHKLNQEGINTHSLGDGFYKSMTIILSRSTLLKPLVQKGNIHFGATGDFLVMSSAFKMQQSFPQAKQRYVIESDFTYLIRTFDPSYLLSSS